MSRTRSIALIAASVIVASHANAAETFTSVNDLDRRPVVQIAEDLGVEPQVFADCFVGVSPAEDFNPTPDRERANKAVLLPCLQAANPAITNDLLDQVMDTYRGQHIATR